MTKYLIAALALTYLFTTASVAQNQPDLIINGDPVDASVDLPEPLRIGRTTDEFRIFGCSATLLNENWVILAAHCIQRELVFFESRNSEWDPAGIAKIVEWYPHPNYSRRPLRNDIALAQISWVRKPADGPIVPLVIDSRPKFGDIVRIFGWGQTSPDGSSKTDSLKDELRFANVAVSRCGDFETDQNPGVFCTTPNAASQTTCAGDSGGPVITIDDAGRAKLVGVISGGVTLNCGLDGGAAIQTSVRDYFPWIARTMRKTASFVQFQAKIPKTYCLEAYFDLPLADSGGIREFNVVASNDCRGGSGQKWELSQLGGLVTKVYPDDDPDDDQRVYMYATQRETAHKNQGYEVRAAQFFSELPAFRWIFRDDGQIESELHGMCLDISRSAPFAHGRDAIVYPCHGGSNQKWRPR